MTGFAVPGAETPWHIPVTVTIYRKKVHHRATKNYQLDLFDPNDGHYEYSAVTSNLALTVRNLWYERIAGSYTNVVGLPVALTARLLGESRHQT